MCFWSVPCVYIFKLTHWVIAIKFDYWITTDSFRVPYTFDSLKVEHDLQSKRVKSNVSCRHFQTIFFSLPVENRVLLFLFTLFRRYWGSKNYSSRSNRLKLRPRPAFLEVKGLGMCELKKSPTNANFPPIRLSMIAVCRNRTILVMLSSRALWLVEFLRSCLRLRQPSFPRLGRRPLF